MWPCMMLSSSLSVSSSSFCTCHGTTESLFRICGLEGQSQMKYGSNKSQVNIIRAKSMWMTVSMNYQVRPTRRDSMLAKWQPRGKVKELKKKSAHCDIWSNDGMAKLTTIWSQNHNSSVTLTIPLIKKKDAGRWVENHNPYPQDTPATHICAEHTDKEEFLRLPYNSHKIFWQRWHWQLQCKKKKWMQHQTAEQWNILQT